VRQADRKYARSIRIGATPAAVWAAIVNVETWPEWASQFKRLERLDAGPLASGSRVHVTPPGTVLERRIRCGKQGCRCGAEPPQLHGPYYQWTRKLNGKTQTRLLSAAQMARYASWFENAKRIRSLTSELEALSLDLAESAEDWG